MTCPKSTNISQISIQEISDFCRLSPKALLKTKYNQRSSHRRCSTTKNVSKYFVKFNLYRGLFLLKLKLYNFKACNFIKL